MSNGYKETKIGRIPEDWELDKLGDYCEKITKGTTPTTHGFKYKKKGINFLKVESVSANNTLIPEMFSFIDNETHNYLKRSIIQENDIVFSIAGAIGRAAIVNNCYLPANTNQALAIIRLKDKVNINLKYLLYYLTSFYLKRHIRSISVQSAQANISLSDLNKFNILLPSSAEQRKIAEILSTVDEAIEKTDTIIKETRQLKKGLMQKLFDFKEYPAESLINLVDRPITYGVVKPGTLDSNGVLFVRAGDIKNGKIKIANLRTISMEISDGYKRTILQGGELLIGLVGYPGEVAVVPPELSGANIARQAGLISLKEKDFTLFTMYYLMSPYGKKKLLFEQLGSAQKVINLSDLRKIKIPQIPKYEREIRTNILSEVDAKIEKEEATKAELEQLKKGLMQVLLTGKVRVKA